MTAAVWAAFLLTEPRVAALTAGPAPAAGPLRPERRFFASEPVTAEVRLERVLPWHRPRVRLLSALGEEWLPDAAAGNRYTFAPAGPRPPGTYRLQVLNGRRVLAELTIEILPDPLTLTGAVLDTAPVAPGAPPPGRREIAPGHGELYAAARIRGLPAGEPVEVRWFREEALIRSEQVEPAGPRPEAVHATLRQPGGLPPGSYRVEFRFRGLTLGDARLTVDWRPPAVSDLTLGTVPAAPGTTPPAASAPGPDTLHAAFTLPVLPPGRTLSAVWYRDGQEVHREPVAAPGPAPVPVRLQYRPGGRLPPAVYAVALVLDGEKVLARAEHTIRPDQAIRLVRLLVGDRLAGNRVQAHQSHLVRPRHVWVTAEVAGGVGARLHIHWYRDGHRIWHSGYREVVPGQHAYTWRLAPVGRETLEPGTYRAVLYVNEAPHGEVTFTVTDDGEPGGGP